ncbi:type I-E CRISPR-associated protein Cas6/Cse3/CasE [Streptomyces sp. NPDC054784]
MTVWLTRILPDLRSPQAQLETTAGHVGLGLHRRLMSLFPDDAGPDPRARYGVLYRAETTPGGRQILLQSTHEPQLDKLPADYGTSATRTLDTLLDALQPGQTLHHRCVANAVRRPGHTTRTLYGLPAVVPLHGTAAEEWWERQSESAGLKPLTLHSQPLDAASGRAGQRGTKSDRNVKHARTQFDGTAAVMDPDLLRQKIHDGIGRGKAYGCGLLTIAPAKSPA